MNELLNMWKENKQFFSEKKVNQIIGIAGDGNIENPITSAQVRELFGALPTDIIKTYVQECLLGFEKSGFVLQDLVNELGRRIGFEVESGNYRGSSKRNGLDGLWKTPDNAIVVEVKTSDTYRISLETLNKYKSMLLRDHPELTQNISILIIAGKQDTGDLEAQIRGSRYAWDIRLISIDSLLKLVDLKETLNDLKTIRQINQLLIPQEYTRLDKLIELIFLSAQDAELDIHSLDEEKKGEKPSSAAKNMVDRASFYNDCAERLNTKFGMSFLRRTKTLFACDQKVGVIINVSKEHLKGGRHKYWFAYHPYFADNLAEYNSQYMLYGCGTADTAFLIPLDLIERAKEHMWTTVRPNGTQYWHINIFKEKNGHYYLQTPVESDEQWICLDSYKI